ncbi:hypothetical protein Ae201684_004038 [Aphanomyces euteiches]|uniref:Uncharacterized protein n=1 Tax=Aphanomyces euteiches TaxID=100861 RepID=A0A6G0XK07_9STRA|nr:hypothetical protein Ae201684_004038 [Aphanomyces euteiches]
MTTQEKEFRELFLVQKAYSRCIQRILRAAQLDFPTTAMYLQTVYNQLERRLKHLRQHNPTKRTSKREEYSLDMTEISFDMDIFMDEFQGLVQEYDLYWRTLQSTVWTCLTCKVLMKPKSHVNRMILSESFCGSLRADRRKASPRHRICIELN